MKKLSLLTAVLILLLSTTLTSAQDDVPVVAILKFGELRPFELIEQGVVDVFSAYGYEDDMNIEFIRGHADFDTLAVETLVADALIAGVDVIVAITTPVLVTATNISSEMDEPPIIVFAGVTNPYTAGVAESPCIKPAHVSGSQASPPYDFIFPMISDIDPSIRNVGIIYNDQELNSVVSIEQIQDINEDIGYNLQIQSVSSPDSVRAVAEAMIMSGVEAFFVSTDSTVTSVMSELGDLGNLAGVPVISADTSQTYTGATVAIGLDYYQDGVDAGLMAVSHLNGDIDIATTAINSQQGISIGVNLDAASTQGIVLSDDFLATANFVIENGESSEVEPALPDLSLEERQEIDAEFLDNLFCSEERIAEEQAELDG